MVQAIQGALWDEPPTGREKPTGIFRPVHYLGSKLRLIEDITAAVDAVEPTGGRVCDIFAGSGTVALALARRRSVTAVDIQEYSRVLCSALLRNFPISPVVLGVTTSAASEGPHAQRLANALQPMIEHEAECLRRAVAGQFDLLCELLEEGSIYAFQLTGPSTLSRPLASALAATSSRLQTFGLSNALQSLITRYYGGVYFSYRQAVALDALLAAADEALPEYRDSFVAIGLSTASDVANTVGKHFAQPLRLRKKDGTVKAHLFAKVIRDRSLDVAKLAAGWAKQYASITPSSFPNRAVCSDYAAFLDSDNDDVRVVYADPPYTRDHYSRYYHILETMARRDVPSVSTSNLNRARLSRGLYRAERYQSPFCVKSSAPAAFERLFALTRGRGVPLVLSYSPFDSGAGAHPRLMTVDRIIQLAKAYYRTVDQISIGRFTHSKLNSSEHALAASTEAEVLVTCRP